MRAFPCWLIGLFLAMAMAAAAAPAPEERSAAIAWRGYEEFGTARVANAMASSTDAQGRIAGQVRPAIFLHPNAQGKATADFPAVKPAGRGRRFLLAYAGIREGFNWEDAEHKPDGVRFTVSANGKEVAGAALRRSVWVPLVADMGDQAEIAIQLATDSGPDENASYDWALFGEPMLVSFEDRPLAAGAAVAGTAGAVVARLGGKATLVVEGIDAAGNPVAGARTESVVAEAGLAGATFDFNAVAECVAWRFRAEGALAADAWGGSWQPALEVTSISPARAVALAGEPVRVRVAVRNRGMAALLASHRAVVTCEGKSKQIERLAPGEPQALEFDLGPKPVGEFSVACAWKAMGAEGSAKAGPFAIWPALPALPAARPTAGHTADLGGGYLLLENTRARWLINARAPGLGALVYAWDGKEWQPAGAVSPIVELVTPDGATAPLGRLHTQVDAEKSARFQAEGFATPAGGPSVRVSVFVRLPPDDGAATVIVRARPEGPMLLGALRGPAVHVGDRCTGTAKGQAFFPGLEYLEGDEASSSTRDLAPPLNERVVPHPYKVTVPLLMVQTKEGGPALALAWNPTQRWDGERTMPSACFASPNFVEQQENHLMQLLVPSVPDHVREHARLSVDGYRWEAGKQLELTQFVIAGMPEGDPTGAFQWFDKWVGFPKPEALARPFEEEMALCRHGFLKSVWDEATQKSKHYHGIKGGANAPGFAALMLMDARAVAKGDDRQRLLERVALIGDLTVKEQGAVGLVGSANCHIMGGEFPYHWGHLPEALAGLRDGAYAALHSQEPDGGWGFYPDEKHAVLGQPGTQVLGTCAGHAYALAKYAAISGDPEVLRGMEKALARLRAFKVPRGAQGWECPLLEPDVLASARAVRAFVWATIATGDRKWLDDARYWARTGLAFQYAWDDGAHPGMRYASIPVFGSTYFTHSWIGLPVQWCGLVYAYALQELMRFDPNPLWRKQAEGITASATYQQWPMDGGELAGLYPDSWGLWFTRRNGVHINPEDIVVNLLALRGLDPGLRSVTVPLGAGKVHVTAPAEVKATAAAGVDADLKYLPGETFYVTLAPVSPAEGARLTANGAPLARADALGAGAVGWAYDPNLKVLTAGVKADGAGKVRLSCAGLSYAVQEQATARAAWEFDAAEGWSAANACKVVAQDGRLVVTVAGHDAYLVSGPASIGADREKRLKARVRLTAGRELGLFWRCTKSPGWGPDKEVHTAVPADGQWHEVTFDLSQHPLWAGTVTQLRLDVEPADVPEGTVLEVDWLRAGQ